LVFTGVGAGVFVGVFLAGFLAVFWWFFSLYSHHINPL
jgi:hypothetical protein